MNECRTKDGFGRSESGWLYTEEEWNYLGLHPAWLKLRECKEEGESESEKVAETPQPVPTLSSPDREAKLEQEPLAQTKPLNELSDRELGKVRSAESVGTGVKSMDHESRIRENERRRTIQLMALKRWYQKKMDDLKLRYQRKYTLKSLHQNEANALKSLYQKEADDLKSLYQKEADDLKSLYQKELDGLDHLQEADRVEPLQGEDERNADMSGLKGPGEF